MEAWFILPFQNLRNNKVTRNGSDKSNFTFASKMTHAVQFCINFIIEKNEWICHTFNYNKNTHGMQMHGKTKHAKEEKKLTSHMDKLSPRLHSFPKPRYYFDFD